jgi:hypothetical protein
MSKLLTPISGAHFLSSDVKLQAHRIIIGGDPCAEICGMGTIRSLILASI